MQTEPIRHQKLASDYISSRHHQPSQLAFVAQPLAERLCVTERHLAAAK